MASDPKRIKVQLDADPRFAAGVGGALRYLAEASGMSEQVCQEFQQAAVTACLNAFRTRTGKCHVVEFLRADDRIEVVVDAGLDGEPIRLARPVSAHS